MEIMRKPYASWDGAMKKSLRRATLPDGAMWKIVKAIPNIPTYVVLEDTVLLGWAIAWALPEGTLVQLYVKKRYRRHGIASALIAHMLSDWERMTLCRWTYATNIFCSQQVIAHPTRISVITWGRNEDEYLGRLPSKAVRSNT